MTWRGINVFALLALVLLVAAMGQSVTGILLESWWLMADAGVCAVAGLGFGVLAVLEDVL